MTALAPLAPTNADRLLRVPPPDWAECFDRLSRSHEGWLATLTTFDEARGEQIEARGLPLGGVVYEAPTKAVEIRLGPLAHSVTDVSRVWLRVGADGAEKALELASADATHALLEFRSALPTEMVNGLAPAPIGE
ncbi:MAG TPA: DUF5335 family protein [Thermoanaerobaculia bacterium]|nr:DUF5335 family protein [Thermoanaerobaculia bacterium]